jgi:signal transduction histidine kinase
MASQPPASTLLSTPPDADASFEDLRQRLDVRTRVLELSFALGQAVSAELQLEPLCDLVVARIGNVFQTEALRLDFLEESTGALVDKRAQGDAERVAELRRLAVDALARRALAGRSDAAAVPLIAERKVKGVLSLAWPPGADRPSREDRLLLEVLAGTIASAIDNAWLYSQIQRMNEQLEENVRLRTRELEAALHELKHTQAGLVEREKMASLGQLTAGIAHEINNPLAYAISNVALARERFQALERISRSHDAAARLEAAADVREGVGQVLGFLDAWCSGSEYHDDVAAFRAEVSTLADAEAKALAGKFLRYVRHREERAGVELLPSIDPLLARAEDGLARVTRIVLDLRAFSRLDEAQVQDVDLDVEIERTLAILAHLAKDRRVRVEHVRGMRAPYACFPARLGQVVLNLVTNALQATAPDGLVTIETHDELQPGAGGEAGDGVRIAVRDTGRGIPAALQSRIFDPFFTTKPVGQGVGLGLSITYRIVEEHGGRIDVESREGVGTCFTVRLPPRGGRHVELEGS